MNSIKNTIVTVTLLAVGYGTYVVLSEPTPTGVARPDLDGVWDPMAPGDAANPAPLVEVPESDSPATLVIPPAAESLPTLGRRSQPGIDSAMEGTLAPNSVYGSDRTPGQHLTEGSNDLAPTPPEMAPMPPELAPPTTAEGMLTGGPSEAPSDEAAPGYYARPPQEGGATDYPETATPQFPSTETSPATSVDPPQSTGGHPGFEETWKAVQTNLQNGQLAEALFTLTVWYEEPALSEDQSQRCIQLLDQLAGTVIYSRESYLESAHIVREGETLAALAEQYNVPGELIARINGILPPYRLDPGESLKVLRGPFRAEVSRSRSEVTVFLGRYYAGRFRARLGPELPVADNTYEVVFKDNGREYFDRRSGERISREDLQNPYGDRWIGLRGEQITAAHNVGIHVDVNDSELCCIAVSSVDADDLSAILSVGSQVVVKP